ncbi:hypothetical protein RhiTH_006993 [Rhizoctonia solani]
MQSKQIIEEVQCLSGPRYNWTKEDTPGQPNTICMREDCHNNCHLGCSDDPDGGWVRNPWPGRRVCGQFYKPMRYTGPLYYFLGGRLLGIYTGTCKSCGHSADDHMLHRYKHTQVRVEMDPELQQKIHAAETEVEKLTVAENHVSKNLGIIEKQVAENLEQIDKLVAEIQGISLSPNFSAYINSTIELLERRANSGSMSETESAQKTYDSIRTLKNYLKILKPSPLYGIMGKDDSAEEEKWEEAGRQTRTVGLSSQAIGTLTLAAFAIRLSRTLIERKRFKPRDPNHVCVVNHFGGTIYARLSNRAKMQDNPKLHDESPAGAQLRTPNEGEIEDGEVLLEAGDVVEWEREKDVIESLFVRRKKAGEYSDTRSIVLSAFPGAATVIGIEEF